MGFNRVKEEFVNINFYLKERVKTNLEDVFIKFTELRIKLKFRKMKKILVLTLSLIAIFTIESCGSKKVVRVDESEQIDLSGRWNDTDAQLVAKQMSAAIIEAPWMSNYTLEEKRKPVVIVGLVRNKTHEHIDTEIFTKEMEKALIVSQKARVVQGKEMRGELREERAAQEGNASLATMKKFGLETGADFMLQGVISSVTDSDRKEKVVFYQIDMELSNIETNEKVWIGDKKIKKVVQN